MSGEPASGAPVSGVPVIDVFSGAGGLSLGAAAAGGDVRVLIDDDEEACGTLRANAQHASGKVLVEDVTGLHGEDLRDAAGLDAADPLVIIGGPPCQPFSKAAYWLDPGEDAAYRRARARGEQVARPGLPAVRPDGRRSLVEELWRLVAQADADGFVFENVPSILHPRNRHVVDGLRAAAQRAGYRTTLFRGNAAGFGVAQRRQRVFLLAAKRAAPAPPTPTHAIKPEPKREPAAEDAGGSDERDGRARENDEREQPAPAAQPTVTAGQALAPYADEAHQEEGEEVTGRWAAHLQQIPPGWNYKWHTAWAGHPSPTFVAEQRFWNFLLKLDPDRPSWTIPASPGPWVGPFHWDSRRLRTPELAALQGFPAGYDFVGDRRARVRQIGNAVPPPLARAVIRQVLDALGPTA